MSNPNCRDVSTALTKVVSKFGKEGWFSDASAYGEGTIVIYYKDTKNCPTNKFLRFAGVRVVWRKVS